jgi:LPPG:FO 2-phospho-L-lactate transferase
VKVVVLAGGYGGARLARALAETVASDGLTVVGNVGDDLELLGLHVSPDLDSILYALAGVGDEERGWGRADETWNALETVAALGGDSWFQLGDRDLGLHLVRTQKLRAGERLSTVTAHLTAAFGIKAQVLPATDDPLRTWVETPAGDFPFQQWYVARGHRDDVTAVRYEGAEQARAAPGVSKAIEAADLTVIAPSNPYLSIGKILAVDQIRTLIESRTAPSVAVSPLIGGRTVKGPADAMLRRFAGGTSPAHVASCYDGLMDALVLDEADAGDRESLRVRPIVAATLMHDAEARRRLAEAVLEAAAVTR